MFGKLKKNNNNNNDKKKKKKWMFNRYSCSIDNSEYISYFIFIL